MNRRFLTIAALAACTLAPLAANAAKHADDINVVIESNGTKMVHTTLKNRSNLTKNLTINGRTVVLVANQQCNLEAPVGTDIVSTDKSIDFELTSGMNGNYVSFR